jgi:hypothetical protein
MKKIDIDKIEKSLEQIKSVQADLSFLERMENLAIATIKPEMKISNYRVALIAASLALLIVANIMMYSQSGDTSTFSDAYNVLPTKSIYNG